MNFGSLNQCANCQDGFIVTPKMKKDLIGIGSVKSKSSNLEFFHKVFGVVNDIFH